MPSSSGAITVSTLATACQNSLASSSWPLSPSATHSLMLAGEAPGGHDSAAQSAAFQDYVPLPRWDCRASPEPRGDSNNLSHIGPHNAVLAVIQLRTAIHGKEFLRRRLNRAQSCCTFAISSPSNAKRLYLIAIFFFSKSGHVDEVITVTRAWPFPALGLCRGGLPWLIRGRPSTARAAARPAGR